VAEQEHNQRLVEVAVTLLLLAVVHHNRLPVQVVIQIRHPAPEEIPHNQVLLAVVVVKHPVLVDLLKHLQVPVDSLVKHQVQAVHLQVHLLIMIRVQLVMLFGKTNGIHIQLVKLL
jgi:hypothetical protein